jgi:hypothetical protein
MNTNFIALVLGAEAGFKEEVAVLERLPRCNMASVSHRGSGSWTPVGSFGEFASGAEESALVSQMRVPPAADGRASRRISSSLSRLERSFKMRRLRARENWRSKELS